MAAGGGEEHISMDDSDRENFRRRGRSPASKRGVGREMGREHEEKDDLRFPRISERGDTRPNRRGSSRERERSEQELERHGVRRDNGRRERSHRSFGIGSHDREPDEDNKPARGLEWDDNGVRSEKSPGSRRRATSRERERSERDYDRGSERRDTLKRDRSPERRRGASRERERGERRRYERALDRGDNGRGERSPRSRRGHSRDRGYGPDDFGRGRSGRRDHRQRERSPGSGVTDYAEKDRGGHDYARGFERRGDRKREISPVSNDGSIRERLADDRNSDLESPQEIKSISTDNSLSPRKRNTNYIAKHEDDGREINAKDRRGLVSLISRPAAEEASDSGEIKSGDEGSDGGDSEENGQQKVPLLSKITTVDDRNPTARDGDRDHRERRDRGAPRLDLDYGDSGDESDEDEESDGDRKARKRKSTRREKEKHSKRHRKHSERSRGKKRKRRRRETSSDEATSDSESASPSSNSEVSESDDGGRKKKAKKQQKKKRRKEKERELERERKRKEKRKRKELKEKKLRAELKKKKREMRSKKPITSSWGKYGILKDIDMWTKKPEFGAWLNEVKKVNIETLANWEEKQMFKEYMEDYNTATFPSKKYYNLDIYHRQQVEKARMKGLAKIVNVERIDFNDEDERRLELQQEREKQKEAEVEALMRKMQSGMAQDMKEQAQLREEMQYQFRLGNTEAAQAIQRRLDPDAEKFTK